MRAFAIALSSMDCSERIDGVTAFCAGDRSGRFGILAGREPLATTLSWGLCSLRIRSEANRQYLAVPGGVLYFAQDVLHLCARLYLRDDDPERIVQRLTHEMHAEEESSRSMHALLRDLDRELMRRLTGELSR